MNYIGVIFVLLFAFILFGCLSYFYVKVFNQLRTQNVDIPEAVFLSFIYSLSYLFGRGTSRENLVISREKIWKQVCPFFILIFGILVIALICIIKIKTL